MADLPHTFPFPSRGWMLVNGILYITFAVLVPLDVASEMLYISLTNWMGLSLCACAIVNGVLAILWLRYFDKLGKQLSR
jgi:hypothetical protein